MKECRPGARRPEWRGGRGPFFAVTGGSFNYPHLTDFDPLFESLRDDPGFREIAEQLAKPRWERVVAWEAEHRKPTR